MPGTVAAVGVVAVTASLAVGLVTVGAAYAHAQRVASVADAAALAAADTASGAVIGVPCERAAQIATSAEMAVVTCELDSLIATVSVAGVFAGFDVVASARAGPPPS